MLTANPISLPFVATRSYAGPAQHDCQPAGYADGAFLTSNVAKQQQAGPAASSSLSTEWAVSTAL